MALRKKNRNPTPKEASTRAWRHALRRLPKLTLTALAHGALPVGVRALRTARKEGVEDLHWKVLGDSLARVFQQSGPVLTKLGQILASRDDLLPEAICLRLESLYNRQPPMPAKALRKILKAAYPRGLPFAEFQDTPIGVGSVGQVHRATLADGRRVIVKVIRPGARREIERDINAATALVDAYFSVFGRDREPTRLMIGRVLEDLRTGFLSELDLQREARTIEEFREKLRSHPKVYVPECHGALSSNRVLVIEELLGTPLSALRGKSGTDSKAAKHAAGLALREILTQIFDDGRFHADPHAGNLMLLDDGRLGLIDFGLTGEFTRKDRSQIARAVKSLLARDADGLISSLLEFGTRPDDFDSTSFRKDLERVLGGRKEEIKSQVTCGGGGGGLDTLVNDLFRVAYQHRIYVPQSTTLLIKTLVTIEGVARSLDPEVNLISAAVPVILKSLTPRWLRLGNLLQGSR